MKHFSLLIEDLDKTNKVSARIQALVRYFQSAEDIDKLWAIALLMDKRPKRPVNTTLLRGWAAELSGVPGWLFEESYHVVGDLAETIALLVQQHYPDQEKPLHYWMSALMDLSGKSDEDKKTFIIEAWQSLGYYETFIFNKLLTGGFRLGISSKIVIKGLSKHTGVEENVLAHRLSGNWSPLNTTFDQLIGKHETSNNISQPFPFCLAYPLETDLTELGNPEDWSVEYKWDGIRGQFIKRGGQYFLWSRGEELITDKFPEYAFFSSRIPDGTVLDGEILPIKDGLPLPFQHLQKRIGRKTLSRKLLEEVPVHFMVYDIVEWQQEDIRHLSFKARRAILEQVVFDVNHPLLILSQQVHFENWQELHSKRESARETGAEGFMLKRQISAYHTGRKKGDWWKWKMEPMTIDAVLIYAMAGHGRRANLYTDYTFAVWQGNSLVPFTKAYSGLTDKEFQEVDAFVRKNTVEKFGPVRSVKPELVFEIAFEGIQPSPRHKSGIALRFPRMKRWRRDKTAQESNTLEDLKEILKMYGE